MHIEEALHINNEAPVVHSLIDGEKAEMALSQSDCDNSDEGDVVNTVGKRLQTTW